MYLLFKSSSWLVTHSPGATHNTHSYANNIKIADIPLSCLAIFLAGSSQCWNKRDKQINDSKRCSGTSALAYISTSILLLNTEKTILYFMYLLRSDGPLAPHSDDARTHLRCFSEENISSLPAGLAAACFSDQATSTGRTYEHRPEPELRMISILLQSDTWCTQSLM